METNQAMHKDLTGKPLEEDDPALTSDSSGIIDLKAIREAIARVEAEAKATVAEENRAVAEARARALAEERARIEAAAAAEAYQNAKAAEEAIAAGRARLEAERQAGIIGMLGNIVSVLVTCKILR